VHGLARTAGLKLIITSGTAPVKMTRVRVTIESSDRHERWRTVGVHENIIQASFRALVDSIEYKLLRERDRKRAVGRGK
jgi:2-isopropylmalate synthase